MKILVKLFLFFLTNILFTSNIFASPVSIPIDILQIQMSAIGNTSGKVSAILADKALKEIYDSMAIEEYGTNVVIESIIDADNQDSIINAVTNISNISSSTANLSSALATISSTVEKSNELINIGNTIKSVTSAGRKITEIVRKADNLSAQISNALSGDPLLISSLKSNSEFYRSNPKAFLNKIRSINVLEIVDTIRNANEINQDIDSINSTIDAVLNQILDKSIVNVQRQKIDEYKFLISKGVPEIVIQDLIIANLSKEDNQLAIGYDIGESIKGKNLYKLEIEENRFWFDGYTVEIEQEGEALERYNSVFYDEPLIATIVTEKPKPIVASGGSHNKVEPYEEQEWVNPNIGEDSPEDTFTNPNSEIKNNEDRDGVIGEAESPNIPLDNQYSYITTGGDYGYNSVETVNSYSVKNGDTLTDVIGSGAVQLKLNVQTATGDKILDTITTTPTTNDGSTQFQYVGWGEYIGTGKTFVAPWDSQTKTVQHGYYTIGIPTNHYPDGGSYPKTATYNGSIQGDYANNTSGNIAGAVSGTVTLNADFTNNSIGGQMNVNVNNAPWETTTFNNINFSQQDNSFNGSMTITGGGTGQIAGGFSGQNAEESAGGFFINKNNGEGVSGIYRAKR